MWELKKWSYNPFLVDKETRKCERRKKENERVLKFVRLLKSPDGREERSLSLINNEINRKKKKGGETRWKSN